MLADGGSRSGEALRGTGRGAAVEWLLAALGLVLIWRYWFFYDDSFVYFRYVDNLLFLRLGLVYNAGEYVEGYSSPLWTLLLVPLRATGLGWDVLVIGAGLAGFLVFARLLMAINRDLSPAGLTTNLPLASLGATYGVLCYFTSGMETMLVQLVAAGYALFILRPSSRPLQLLVALSPLVRNELLLALVVALTWSWIARRRPPFLLLLLSALFGGAWLAFRVVYYADVFPSTFYLKNDVHPAQGLRHVHDVLSAYHTYELFAAGTVLAVLMKLRAVDLALARRAAMLAAALAVTAYIVKIGGAPIHYRYLAFPFVLAICALSGLPEQALSAWAPRRGRRIAPALGLGVALVTLTFHPPQLDRHPLRDGVEVRYVNGINDAQYHRDKIPPAGPWREITPALQRDYRRRHPGFSYQGVASEGWCEIAYRKYDQRIVHSWGLTDAVLARVDTPATRPGHKRQLWSLAERLVEIYEGAERPEPGMYRRAVEAGGAPAWIERNLEAIEVVERKIFNRHEALENLTLAATFPGKIRVRRPRRGRRAKGQRARGSEN